MTNQQLAEKILAKEDAITWKQSRSGGKGGQHANKASTKAELYFAIPDSKLLTDDQKDRLLDQLDVSNEGVLRITYDNRRSLRQNQKKCKETFIETLTEALKKTKKRKTTIPPNVAKKIDEQREKNKKHHSKKKQRRQNPKPRDIDINKT